MALTKYVSPFEYDVPRISIFIPKMSSIYVSPIFATQYHIYNIIGPTTVLTIWSINLMPIKRQKKFASCVTSNLTSDDITLFILWIPSNLTQQLFYILLDDPFYRLGTIHTKHPCKCIFWKLSLILAMENGDIQQVSLSVNSSMKTQLGTLYPQYLDIIWWYP